MLSPAAATLTAALVRSPQATASAGWPYTTACSPNRISLPGADAVISAFGRSAAPGGGSACFVAALVDGGDDVAGEADAAVAAGLADEAPLPEPPPIALGGLGVIINCKFASRPLFSWGAARVAIHSAL